MKTKNKLLTMIVIVVGLVVTGCNFTEKKDEKYLEDARVAITNRDYKLASKHLELVLKANAKNKEAQILLSYLQFEDYMLHAAFWEKDYEAMNYLINIVHDIDFADPRFKAPILVLAAAWSHEDIVKMLLQAGSDPNAGADIHGLTALMWACKTFDEQLEMVRVLLEAGAEVNIKSKHNETPLSIALEYGNDDSAALLKEYGAQE